MLAGIFESCGKKLPWKEGSLRNFSLIILLFLCIFRKEYEKGIMVFLLYFTSIASRLEPELCTKR